MRRLKDNRGFLVLAAYMIPVLLGLVALVIEWNQLRAIKNELKSACDAAALSGVLRAEVEPTDITYESEYDNQGRVVRVVPVVGSYRLVNDQQRAFWAAHATFTKNLQALGWSTDGTNRVSVLEVHGEPQSSGLSDSVVGMDVAGDDEFVFRATVRVKTLLIGPVLYALKNTMGIPLPVTDMGEIIITEESTARTKVKIEQ